MTPILTDFSQKSCWTALHK